MSTNTVVFTLDIDWAPEAVIEETLELFAAHNIKATLFATHDSEVLTQANPNLFEIGIHPNFNRLLSGDTEQEHSAKVIQDLLALYPKALGVRSHSMTQSSLLLQQFWEQGLLYDVNMFFPYHSNLKPWKHWNGLLRIPYNWEDDVHWEYGHRFQTLGVELTKGLNILNFHPIHIYLNTSTAKDYLQARPFYQDPEKLRVLRQQNPRIGTYSMLMNVFQEIKSKQLTVSHLKEVYLNHSQQ